MSGITLSTAAAIYPMEALSREVARVAAIGARLACMSDMRGVNLRPLKFMITEALETAHRAAGSGDIPSILRSLRSLQDFNA